MVRRAAGDPVQVGELPFVPAAGSWWNGHLYWACFTSGVGVWAPGEEPRFELPELTLFAIDAEADGLLLTPSARDAGGNLLRVRARHAWKWTGQHAPTRVAVGADGAPCSRAAGAHGWTAVAYHEADAVHLESADGRRARMTCYYPLAVGWLGASLLVSSIEGELLLFADLAGRLG
jgi:hypothetical protein